MDFPISLCNTHSCMTSLPLGFYLISLAATFSSLFLTCNQPLAKFLFYVYSLFRYSHLSPWPSPFMCQQFPNSYLYHCIFFQTSVIYIQLSISPFGCLIGKSNLTFLKLKILTSFLHFLLCNISLPLNLSHLNK